MVAITKNKMADQTKEYIKELVRLTKYNLTAIGYEKLTVDGTVKSLASIPATAKYAEVTLESGATGVAVRYLELGGSGTQPSTTAGIGKSDLDMWDVHGQHNLVNFRITQAQAGTHNIYVQYYS